MRPTSAAAENKMNDQSSGPFLKQSSSGGMDISLSGFIWGLVLILCLAALTYLSVSFFWGKFSRAEVFFAECAREMIQTGNFITPLYHHQPFFDKPIFVYWLIIGMFKLLGFNHLAARLPSIFASLITIASTAIAGRYLSSQSGKRTGLIAASMLSSAFMFLSFSTLCMSDMFLVMFDTLSLIFVYAGITLANKRTFYWWLAALSMGLAFLTKGPVGVVLPAMASLIYLTVTKNLGLIKPLHILLALITIAIIASPWFYAAYLANGTGALVYFFVRENFQRFAGATYDSQKPFWYMIAALFLGFAPWSVLLPPAFYKFGLSIKQAPVRARTGEPVRPAGGTKSAPTSCPLAPIPTGSPAISLTNLPADLSVELFLWIWIFIAVGFFCFSRGKCDYYTLPAYPAAAILAARYIESLVADKKSFWRRNLPTLISTIAASIFMLTTAFAVFVLPRINRLEPIDTYAALIKKGPSNLRVAVDKSLSSWIDEILFQSGNDPRKLDDLNQAEQFVADHSPALLIMPLDKYKSISNQAKQGWHIIVGNRVATHSLTPGYIISRHGHIEDAIPVVVSTNIKDLRIPNEIQN